MTDGWNDAERRNIVDNARQKLIAMKAINNPEAKVFIIRVEGDDNDLNLTSFKITTITVCEPLDYGEKNVDNGS